MYNNYSIVENSSRTWIPLIAVDQWREMRIRTELRAEILDNLRVWTWSFVLAKSHHAWNSICSTTLQDHIHHTSLVIIKWILKKMFENSRRFRVYRLDQWIPGVQCSLRVWGRPSEVERSDSFCLGDVSSGQGQRQCCIEPWNYSNDYSLNTRTL